MQVAQSEFGGTMKYSKISDCLSAHYCALLLMVMTWLVFPMTLSAQEITIGTGGPTGVYYPAGKAICNAVNKGTSAHGIHCTAIATGGSINNVKKLQGSMIDFGIVQSDVQYYAVNGFGPFRIAGPDKKLRAALGLFSESFTVIARADAHIRTLDDLKGKRVNVGNLGSGHRANMELVMKAKGWTLADFGVATYFTSDQQGKALCDNKIDAFVFMAGHPNESIIATSQHCKVVLVQTYDAAIKALIKKYPYFNAVRIPSDTYKGTGNSTATYGVTATLMTSAKTSDKIVQTVITSIFNHFSDFQFEHTALLYLKPETMVKAKHTAPIHSGARSYFGRVNYSPKIEHIPKAPH